MSTFDEDAFKKAAESNRSFFGIQYEYSELLASIHTNSSAYTISIGNGDIDGAKTYLTDSEIDAEFDFITKQLAM